MADNTVINAATTPGQSIATKDIGGVNHELVLLEFSDGAGGAIEVSAANPLPVDATIDTTGLATSANQSTEIAALASIAAEDFATQATLAALLAKVIAAPSTEAKQDAMIVLLTTIAAITQPLTDTQLRATPVPVSGTITTTGGLTDAQLRATPVPVSATDLDIRNLVFATDKADVSGSTGVGVTGTFFQATQPVSAAALPLPSGAATAANQQTDALTNTQLRLTPVPVSGTVAVTGAGDATAANQATQITAEQAIQAAVQIMDDWDESDRAKVNLIVGQAGIAAGTGVDGVTVPRVSLATNVALPAGTNLLGIVQSKDLPDASATYALTNVTSTAYEASHVIKASAGYLFMVTGYNSKTSSQFIMISNTTSVPADAQTPVLLFTVPASSNFSLDLGKYGRYFSTGICIFNSSTAPTKLIGSADCFFDCQII